MGIHEILKYLAERVHGLTPEDRKTVIGEIGKLTDEADPAAEPVVQAVETIADHVGAPETAEGTAPA